MRICRFWWCGTEGPCPGSCPTPAIAKKNRPVTLFSRARAATESIAELSPPCHPGLDPGSMLADYLRCSGFRGSPASRGLPGGNSLSFCVAKKKVSKEKGAPAVCVPPSLTLRRATCGARSSRGRARTRLRLRQSPVLIRLALRSSAHTEGWWMKAGADSGTDAGRPDAQSASGRSTWLSCMHVAAAHVAK